jgi:hypothetical protein
LNFIPISNLSAYAREILIFKETKILVIKNHLNKKLVNFLTISQLWVKDMGTKNISIITKNLRNIHLLILEFLARSILVMDLRILKVKK